MTGIRPVRSFVMTHTSRLLAAACLLAMSPSANAQATVRSEPSAITSVMSSAYSPLQDETLIVDVREEAEWSETGVPRGAATISVSRPDFVEAVIARVGGDKSRPVAVICRSGGRSSRAANQLAAAGFTRIINVADGMTGRGPEGGGWIAAGQPVSPWSRASDNAPAQR
jgi:rhodanese-related sulfurtransferase